MLTMTLLLATLATRRSPCWMILWPCTCTLGTDARGARSRGGGPDPLCCCCCWRRLAICCGVTAMGWWTDTQTDRGMVEWQGKREHQWRNGTDGWRPELLNYGLLPYSRCLKWLTVCGFLFMWIFPKVQTPTCAPLTSGGMTIWELGLEGTCCCPPRTSGGGMTVPELRLVTCKYTDCVHVAWDQFTAVLFCSPLYI